MNHSYGSNILHDKMNSMAFPGGAYVRATAYQQPQAFHQQTAFPHRNKELDPSLPAFQPTGTELQRYGPTVEPTPPHTPANMCGSGISELQRYTMETHFKHAADMTRVERMARKNQQDIQDTQAIVANDLRTLNARLQHLQTQLEKQQGGSEESLAVAKRGPGILEIDVAAPEIMLEHFDKAQVADAYLEQAEVMEETAARLRRDVAELGIDVWSKMGELDLVNAPTVEAETPDAPLIVNGGNFETPTHMPARRGKSEIASRAVEIRTPAESETVDPTAKDDSANTDVKAKQQDSTDKITTPLAAETHGESKAWQPLAVRNMAIPQPIDVTDNVETFTWEHLRLNLRGEQWSPGYYFIAHNSNLVSKAYWIMDGEYDPFLPPAPGQHGVKLTAFFNSTFSKPGEAPDEENYKDTPVFVRPEGCSEYIYYGNYSQTRYSDKLDYDRVMETVPERVRQYWAEQLSCDPRPKWVIDCLMEHFWPRPIYYGPVPTDEAESAATENTTELEKRVTKALNDYAEDLKQWEKETRMKASLLSKAAIMDAFSTADEAPVPGLRLYWEYMEFHQYDHSLYDGLVRLKGMPPPGVPAKAMPKKEHKVWTKQELMQLKTQPNGASNTPSVQQAAKQAMLAREEISKAAAAAGGKIVRVPANGVQTLHLAVPAASTSSPTTAINTAQSGRRHTGGTKPWVKAAEKAEVVKAAGKTEVTKREVSEEQMQAAKAFANLATRAGNGRGKGGPPHLRR